MTTTTTSSPTTTIIIGAVFAAILVIVIILAIRRREIVFEGEVIDKNIVENVNQPPMNNGGNLNNGGINMITNGGIQHEYYIKVKTSTNKKIKYKISSGMYEIIKIGDMVSKPKGTTDITITSSAANTTSSPNVTSPPPSPPTTPPISPPTVPPNTPPTVVS